MNVLSELRSPLYCTLEEIGTSEEELQQLRRTQFLARASRYLNDLRNGKGDTFAAKHLVLNLRIVGAKFEDIGTTEEEAQRLYEQAVQFEAAEDQLDAAIEDGVEERLPDIEKILPKDVN